MSPLVSVIIPAYNRGRYVGQTIESVLNQTYKNSEVIVIDDGSTDDTGAVVSRFQPAVRYVWLENRERGAARNHGLQLARGEYIAFLDSDDLWMPGKLERDLMFFRQRPDVGFVYSDVQLVDANLRTLRRIRGKGFEGWVTNHLLLNNFVSFSAHLARTEPMRKIGGFREERELAGSEDWEAWVRLSTVVKFGHIAVPTARIRVHDSNTMSDAAVMERSMRHACAVMAASDYLTAEQRRLLARTRAMVNLASAINYCVAGDRSRAWKRMFSAIRKSPTIILDPRFIYNCLHNLLPKSVSVRLRNMRNRVLALSNSSS